MMVRFRLSSSMGNLETIYQDLPAADRRTLDEKAATRGLSPIDLLRHEIEKDLQVRKESMQSKSLGYRFVSERDFSIHTLLAWLSAPYL